MSNFKKRKTAALLTFVSMLGGKSPMSKALEITKNPGVTKTLAAEKNAVLNGKKKIVIDWVKNHKILTGGIGTLFLGGIVTASVFLAKHIKNENKNKNKNKIENNGDKPNNLNDELNDLNNEEKYENKIDKNKNDNDNNNDSEENNETNISNENEKNKENDEDNLNNEENENIQIQIENKKENIINLNTNMENDNNKNIIIINKKPEENKINYENTQTKNLNIEEKNKNIINLNINNEENKEKKIIPEKSIKPKFNNKFEFAKPKKMNQKLFEALQGCLTILSKNKDSIKIKEVADCFNNNLELKKIVLDKWENIPSEGFVFSFYITVKNNKYIIDFKYLKKNHKGYVFDENVDVREVRSSQQLNNKQITINEGVKKRKEEQKNKKKK